MNLSAKEWAKKVVESNSLQREKDSVNEVKNGYDCGITIDSFQDIKEGDIIETYEMVEVKR